VGGHCHTLNALPLVKSHGAHCTGGRWAPGPVWTYMVNRKSLASTKDQTLVHPACSKSLYRLQLRTVMSSWM